MDWNAASEPLMFFAFWYACRSFAVQARATFLSSLPDQPFLRLAGSMFDEARIANSRMSSRVFGIGYVLISEAILASQAFAIRFALEESTSSSRALIFLLSSSSIESERDLTEAQADTSRSSCPHEGQTAANGGSASPQLGHLLSFWGDDLGILLSVPSTGAPQRAQNLALSGSSLPHLVQNIFLLTQKGPAAWTEPG